MPFKTGHSAKGQSAEAKAMKKSHFTKKQIKEAKTTGEIQEDLLPENPADDPGTGDKIDPETGELTSESERRRKSIMSGMRITTEDGGAIQEEYIAYLTKLSADKSHRKFSIKIDQVKDVHEMSRLLSRKLSFTITIEVVEEKRKGKDTKWRKVSFPTNITKFQQSLQNGTATMEGIVTQAAFCRLSDINANWKEKVVIRVSDRQLQLGETV